jgi:hypothetical protein
MSLMGRLRCKTCNAGLWWWWYVFSSSFVGAFIFGDDLFFFLQDDTQITYVGQLLRESRRFTVKAVQARVIFEYLYGNMECCLTYEIC